MKINRSINVKTMIMWVARIIVMVAFGAVQLAGSLIVGVGTIILKGLGVILAIASGMLFFSGAFSGGNLIVVLVISTLMFWLPELAQAALIALTILEAKLIDMLRVI